MPADKMLKVYNICEVRMIHIFVFVQSQVWCYWFGVIEWLLRHSADGGETVDRFAASLAAQFSNRQSIATATIL